MKCSADVGRHGDWSSVCHVNLDPCLDISEHQSLQGWAGESGIMASKPPPLRPSGPRWSPPPLAQKNLPAASSRPPPPALLGMTFKQNPGSLQAPSLHRACPLFAKPRAQINKWRNLCKEINNNPVPPGPASSQNKCSWDTGGPAGRRGGWGAGEDNGKKMRSDPHEGPLALIP